MENVFTKSGLDRLHQVMSRHVDAGIPGIVTLISRNGETHVDALGASPDAIFRISSMTKPVTAVAAMILCEECGLRLDDPIDDFLPELSNRKVIRSLTAALDDTVPAERPITTRDLLTFRSGYGYVFAPPGESPLVDAINAAMTIGPPLPSHMPAPDEYVRRLATLPLAEQPGAQWRYNTGSEILSVLVARAAGTPFDRFCSERIFEPLAMHDTGFVVSEEQRGRFTTAYLTNPADGSLTVFDEPDGDWSHRPAFPNGAAGLVSTAADYHAFASMLMGGGAPLLARASVALMTTDHLTDANKATATLVPGFWDDHGWGFGVSILRRRTGCQSPGTYGWDGGLGTSWFNDPSEDLTAILLTQAAWTSPSPPPVCRDFWTSAYGALT
jgi:CubicO group peptidase (beta-lactamase class C family)